MFRLRVLAVCVACILAGSAMAVEMPVPLLRWDVATSWDVSTGMVLSSGSLPAGAWNPVPGNVAYWLNPPSYDGSPVPEDQQAEFITRFGAPQYVPATGDSRAYLNFDKYGMIALDGTGYGAGIYDSTVGYTEMAYLYVSSDMHVLQNAGIGAHHSYDDQCMFLYSSQGRNFHSSTVMVKDGMTWAAASGFGTPARPDKDNVNALIPLDRWFLFVKVHDVENQQVRYYIDDELAGWIDYEDDLTGFVYQGTAIGAFGLNERNIRGLGVSYLAAYDCVLTDDQIKASYATLTAIPEPATMSLLALGGLALLRRRARPECVWRV